MMLSDLAVRRPVFAAVAAIVLCVIGAAAFFFLPVRELPDVDPPIVSVSTSYAGASAEVIESRITEPIEQQIAGQAAAADGGARGLQAPLLFAPSTGWDIWNAEPGKRRAAGWKRWHGDGNGGWAEGEGDAVMVAGLRTPVAA